MAEFEKKKLIVEIGFGSKPFPTVGRRKIAPLERYLGVDFGYNKDFLQEAKNAVSKLGNNDKIHLVRGTAFSLPLGDQIASEVVFSNVFDFMEYTQKSEAIAEAKRILRRDGKVVVLQTYSSSLVPFDQLNSQFEYAGFRCVTKSINSMRQIEEYAKNPYLEVDVSEDATISFFGLAYASVFRLTNESSLSVEDLAHTLGITIDS